MGIDARILLRIKGPAPSKAQIKLWSWNIAASIGAEHFLLNKIEGRGAIRLSNSSSWDEPGETGKIYSQDGPCIKANLGETLLEVSLWSRLYTVGYERGDLLTLCAVAEWCEQNIPECEVWYGGDSSGVVAEPWPEVAR